MQDRELAVLKKCYLIARKNTHPVFGHRQLYVKGRSDAAEEIKRWALKEFRISEEQWRQISSNNQLSLLS